MKQLSKIKSPDLCQLQIIEIHCIRIHKNIIGILRTLQVKYLIISINFWLTFFYKNSVTCFASN
jgi:hypothetical protein